MRRHELLPALYAGKFDKELRAVYGAAALEPIYARLARVVDGFCAQFPDGAARDLMLFSAPGRTELLGNHTDHQGGCVLAAAVDMDTLACVARNDDAAVRVCSEGRKSAIVSLDVLAPQEAERGRSPSLVRGMAAYTAERCGKLMGFDAYTQTQVLRGSGLSSSAAFEVLLGTILSTLSERGALDAQAIAQLAQRAENNYYGKPCGLMDQMACAVGGVVGIDFADAKAPLVRSCALDWEAQGYALVIIDSGADHAALDSEYAAIPREMRAVAKALGGEILSEVAEDDFLARRAELETLCGKRAAARAEHYFAETQRAKLGYNALMRGDFDAFLSLVRESGHSSETLLQNVALDRAGGDRLLRVIEKARALSGARGAARVHGGGFAGTAQAWVEQEGLPDFIAAMEGFCGAGSCHVVHSRNVGAALLAQ